MNAVWLDGKRIAFIRDAAIWVVDADGSGERKLQQESTTIYGRRWSANGERLLVRGNQLRTPQTTGLIT